MKTLLIAFFSVFAFISSNGADGVSHQAVAEAVVVKGFVVDVRVLFGGDGYLSPPTVTLRGAGTGATAVAQVANGKVVSVDVTDAGIGYFGNVIVEIGPSSYPDVTSIQLYAGITLLGQPGSKVQLQYASTLDDPYPWQSLTNFIMPQAKLYYFDPLVSTRRYYRTIPIPTNPAPANLVWIPPGSFQMGSPLQEAGRGLDETAHTVTFTEGFYMSAREVTQVEFMTAQFALPSTYTTNGGVNLPVENVTWAEAVAFCESLTQKEQSTGRLPDGFVYRLPTEAEWEYAARAGSADSYFFGADANKLTNFAWIATNSGGHENPEATRVPNAWGLSDMVGNVAEWCLDWYGALTSERAFNPQGSTNGSLRVVRGAGWDATAPECRSASRGSFNPTQRSPKLGFRTVLARGTPTLIANPDPTHLVWVPPGTFFMGSPVGELGRNPDETRHLVTLTRGFWMSKFVVSVGEFSNLTGIQFGGDPRVMAGVNFGQAINYCVLLTERERKAGRLPAGYIYRLPTEAEWEYAVRNGTQTRRFYGDDLTDISFCSFSDCFSSISGASLPSPAGLFDVYERNNAGQLCSDWYAVHVSSQVTDPKGPSTGTFRVLKGLTRSAARSYNGIDDTRYQFRVVLGKP